MRFFFFLFALLCGFSLTAQSFQSELRTIPKAAEVDLRSVEQDFFPSIQNFAAPSPGGDSYRDYLATVKHEQKERNPSTIQPIPDVSSAEPPNLLTGLEVLDQEFAGIPNDNDMSISNDLKMITSINSVIQMHDLSGPAPVELGTFSLQQFSESLGDYQFAFDPKSEYDPEADRFVVTFLNDYDSLASRIVVAFSQTNDPMGLWNLYEIPGNPLDNGKWSDYPMICLTEDELFLTINLLDQNQSWQLGFHETLIWQINKNSGYAGVELETRLHSGSAYYNERPIRNLIPVKGGAGLKGPNQYFLSNRNFDIANDSIFLIEITGLMNDPNTEVVVDVLQSDLEYGVPPFGQQDGDRELDTNDGRILGAYLEDDQIEFVANSYDSLTNACAVYHGIIEDVNGERELSAQFVRYFGRDIAYPNISYTGQQYGDRQSIINFLYTSPTAYPGSAAVFSNDGDYSNVIILKEGEYLTGAFTSSYQRWGDYTGSQSKYDEPGKVFVVGSWTRKFGTGIPFAYGRSRSWVSELSSPFTTFAGIETASEPVEQQVYPNPASDRVQVEFTLKKESALSMRLYDSNGQLVKTITQHRVSAGMNIFSFSVSHLAKGSYILRIEGKDGVISTKKIIVS